MDRVRLALPKELKHLKTVPAHLPFQVKFLPEIYQSSHEISISSSHLPLLMVISEGEYTKWLRKLPEKQLSKIGIIIVEEEEEEAPPIHLGEDHHVLAWIDRNISKKRWGFVLTESTRAFDNIVHLKDLEQEVEYQKFEVNQLHEIGIALSVEKDQGRLLDLIITNAMELTHADAGSLYLIEEIPGIREDSDDYYKNKRFRFEVAKNSSRKVPFKSFVLDINKESIYGYVALTSKPVNIPDAYFIDTNKKYSWGGREFDRSINYRTKSMLTVPMFGHEDTVIGVIQLINSKKDASLMLSSDSQEILEQVTSFTPQHAKAIQSIASQAAVALQNKRLLDSIQILFDGFINASVKAIESRDPTTSGHSSRVAALTVGLAEVVSGSKNGPFRKINFTADHLQEVRYASLLHDFGKIGVREEVLVKSKKLYLHEQQAIADRFKLIRKCIELEASKKQLNYALEKTKEETQIYIENSEQALTEQLDQLDDYIKFIIRCNEPTVLAQGGFEQLKEIGNLLISNTNLSMASHYLKSSEIASLSVNKGSLNPHDRQEIESHVTHTYKFLSIIPWTKSLGNVAKIAYAHHEKLDGTGYPLQLKQDQIPLQSQMMTIADIYDALTAWDRPYKQAIPSERALNILEYEAQDNHVNEDLLELFIEAKIYLIVARPMN